MNAYNSAPVSDYLGYGMKRHEALEQRRVDRTRLMVESAQRLRDEREARDRKRLEFLREAKATLLTEGLFSLTMRSLPQDITKEEAVYAESIIFNFVKEEGADKLLKDYQTKTEILSSLSGYVTDTFNKIVKESETEASDTFAVKTKTSEDFFKKLEGLGDAAVEKKIIGKVAGEVEEFMAKQAQDNAAIEELANKAKEKIDKAKGRTPEEVEAVQAEHVRMFNYKKDNMRFSRPRSVFEEMVYSISTSAVKNESVREAFFVTEAGRLDVSNVIRTASIMYTVLECMCTYRMKEFTPQVIQSLITNI